MNIWVQDAKDFGLWDDLRLLWDYRKICRESLDAENANRLPENAERRIGLIEALSEFDKRIQELSIVSEIHEAGNDMREYKRIIALAMGNDFVDALFDATTSETLTKNFSAALRLIAVSCAYHGGIEDEEALGILKALNPGAQYNAQMLERVMSELFRPRVMLPVGERVRISGGETGVVTGYGFCEGAKMYLVALDNMMNSRYTIRIIVVHPNNASKLEGA